MSVHEAISTFEQRARTARKNGIAVIGVDETLLTLRAMPPGEVVELFHFSGRERVFSILVRTPAEDLVGCMGVRRS